MRVIKIDSNNKIVEVKEMLPHYKLQENEQMSEVGKLGQVKQPDGSFVDDTTVTHQPHIPTNTEIAQMISDLQADLIIAGVI